MSENTLQVKPFPDEYIASVCGEQAIKNSPALLQESKEIMRFLGIPITYRSFKALSPLTNSVNLRRDKIDYISDYKSKQFEAGSSGSQGISSINLMRRPFNIYLTENSVLLSPQYNGFGLSKIISAVSFIIATLFFGVLFLVGLLGKILLLILLPIAAYAFFLYKFYLFFINKGYILHSSIDSIKRVDKKNKTITLEGVFNAGTSKLIKSSLSQEIFVGGNIQYFPKGSLNFK